ncbi:MAG TPA: GntR family transcriptional regulator [archaeon]|nr:GntR family transcriptional regulator [archaeon]
MTIDKVTGISGRAPGSAIAFMLDLQSGIPTYLQIVQQVEAALSLGYLVEGDQLPTVKDVVSSVAINPNTVLKAYRELESRGVAAGRPGVGTFVVAAPPVLGAKELSALRSSLIRGWLREAKGAGLSQEAILALFNSAVGEVSELSNKTVPKR